MPPNAGAGSVATEAPAGWVYRVAVNQTRSSGRRSRRAAELVHLVAAEGATRPPREPLDPVLAAAIHALSPPHRQVIVLRYVLDLSVTEIARVLHLREGTVRSRTSRALDELRGRLPATEGSSRGR